MSAPLSPQLQLSSLKPPWSTILSTSSLSQCCLSLLSLSLRLLPSPSSLSTLRLFVSPPFFFSGYTRPTNSQSTAKRQALPIQVGGGPFYGIVPPSPGFEATSPPPSGFNSTTPIFSGTPNATLPDSGNMTVSPFPTFNSTVLPFSLPSDAAFPIAIGSSEALPTLPIDVSPDHISAGVPTDTFPTDTPANPTPTDGFADPTSTNVSVDPTPTNTVGTDF